MVVQCQRGALQDWPTWEGSGFIFREHPEDAGRVYAHNAALAKARGES